MCVDKDLLRCKLVCDVKPGTDPYPLLARSWNRSWLAFVTFTAYKKVKIEFKKAQYVLNRCKDLFQRKKYFGVRFIQHFCSSNTTEKKKKRNRETRKNARYFIFRELLLKHSEFQCLLQKFSIFLIRLIYFFLTFNSSFIIIIILHHHHRHHHHYLPYQNKKEGFIKFTIMGRRPQESTRLTTEATSAIINK